MKNRKKLSPVKPTKMVTKSKKDVPKQLDGTSFVAALDIVAVVFQTANEYNLFYIMGPDYIASANNFRYAAIASVDTGLESEIVLPWNPFHSVMKKAICKDKNVKLSVNESSLHISAGRFSADFDLVSAETSSEFLTSFKHFEHRDTKGVSVPKDLVDALSLCLFSYSKRSELGVLSNICIYSDRCVASDNYRISRYVLSDSIDIKNYVLVPGDFIRTTISFFKDKGISHIIFDDKMLYFKNKDGIHIGTAYDKSEFVELDTFIDSRTPIAEVDLSKTDVLSVLDSVKDINLGMVDMDRFVDVELSDRKMSLSCSTEKNKAESFCDISEVRLSKPIKFTINSMFFSEVMKYAPKLVVLKEADSLLFEAGNFKQLLSLKATD